jgi:hypothetical protein
MFNYPGTVPRTFKLTEEADLHCHVCDGAHKDGNLFRAATSKWNFQFWVMGEQDCVRSFVRVPVSGRGCDQPSLCLLNRFVQILPKDARRCRGTFLVLVIAACHLLWFAAASTRASPRFCQRVEHARRSRAVRIDGRLTESLRCLCTASWLRVIGSHGRRPRNALTNQGITTESYAIRDGACWNAPIIPLYSIHSAGLGSTERHLEHGLGPLG